MKNKNNQFSLNKMNQFQQIHLHKCKHTQKLIHNREYHFKDKKIQDEIKKKKKKFCGFCKSIILLEKQKSRNYFFFVDLSSACTFLVF